MAKQYIFSNLTDSNLCKLAPFPRPPKGPLPNPAVNWYIGTKPRGYKPYLVKVISDLAGNAVSPALTFMFLHNETGVDLSGPHTISLADLNDQTKSCSALPASAIFVDLKADPTADCGFLFLTDGYAASIVTKPQAAQPVNLLVDAAGDGKYPKGASASPTSLVSALHKLLRGDGKEPIALSQAEQGAVAALLRML